MRSQSFALFAAVVAMMSSASAHAAGFVLPSTLYTGTGYGEINGVPCTGLSVTVLTGPANVSGEADYGDVQYVNPLGSPCADYSVATRVWADGSLSAFTVTYLPGFAPSFTPTVVCAGSSGPGTVGFNNQAGPVLNAYLLAPLTVGACTVDTDIEVNGLVKI